jgi:hypothetical protein
MVSCPSCQRHHRAADVTCPFCGVAATGASGTRLGARWTQRAARALCLAAAPLLLAACGLSSQTCDTADTACDTTDADGDGFIASDDCDDTSAAVNPGATEACDDQIDNDCNGLTDADDTAACPTG